MRIVLAVFAAMMVAGACSYDDPAPDGRFKCDGAHPCPGDQACIAGICSGGDAGSGSGSPDGVKCGSTSCGADMQCCAGPISEPICQAVGASCNSGAVASCDGVEDCGTGEACCGASNAACGADTCSARTCQSSADCLTAGATNCCFDLGYLPWGFCC